MVADAEGFLQPTVDAEQCAHCGKCESVCPVLHPGKPRQPLAVYAAKAKDDELRKISSSGGIFSLLARQVIARGGVVFGAAFEPKTFRVIHQAARNEEELDALRGSKYVQSDLGNTFAEVRDLLRQGVEVLYSGCPCQISALKMYLGEERRNLILVDIICHGVPSPVAWQMFLNDEEIVAGCRLAHIVGRRNCKWNDFGITLEFLNGVRKSFRGAFRQNPYMAAYLNRWMNRWSCHHCECRQFKSGSDLTVGDDWAHYSESCEQDKRYGISCVFANTIKGREIFNLIKGHAHVGVVDYAYEVNLNLAVLKDDDVPSNRKLFYGDISRLGFVGAVNRLLPKRECSLFIHIAWWLKRLIVNFEINKF